jgi:hypothetical protein
MGEEQDEHIQRKKENHEEVHNKVEERQTK